MGWRFLFVGSRSTQRTAVQPQSTAPTLLWLKSMARAPDSGENASSSDAPAAVPVSVEPILAQRDRLLRALIPTLGDAAEDVLQQVYERALARADTVRVRESVDAWFARVLRNVTIDHLRREAVRDRTRRRADGEAPPLEDTEAAIRLCVGELIPELREAHACVLRRIDLENASTRDVARELDTTPNNVRVRLHRARAVLRMKLLAYCARTAAAANRAADARRQPPRGGSYASQWRQPSTGRRCGRA